MDLIERYLAAVGRQLPSRQAGDIQAELRDVLMTRVEEQEERLGRPLDKAEVEALLIDFGHPLLVAGRYRRIQHLIGPEIFPFWWAGLKVTLGITAGVFLLLAVLGVAAQSSEQEFRRFIPSMWSALCIAFTSVTLTAVVVERYVSARVLLKWRPSRLPPPHRRRPTPFDRTVEIGASVVFILWWLGVIHFQNWLPAPHFLRVDLAPVWAEYKLWVLVYMLVVIGVNLLAQFRPSAVRLNGWLGIGRHVFGAAILIGVLQAGRWLDISGSAIPPHAMAIAQANFDKGMYAGIVATIAFMLARAGLEAWRMWRDAPRAEATA
ncbi:MAG TPA: hypothetical protein VGH86_17720 [Phenylobacterium sp.]